RNPHIHLAINDVRPSQKQQSKRGRYDEIAAEVHPQNSVTARVVKRKQQAPNHPAVTRHAAFPDSQDRQRLAQHFRLVEEHVAETPANNHAEQGAAGDEIAYPLWRQIGGSALGPAEGKKIAWNERLDINNAIPSRCVVVIDAENDPNEAVQILGEHLRCAIISTGTSRTQMGSAGARDSLMTWVTLSNGACPRFFPLEAGIFDLARPLIFTGE